MGLHHHRQTDLAAKIYLIYTELHRPLQADLGPRNSQAIMEHSHLHLVGLETRTKWKTMELLHLLHQVALEARIHQTSTTSHPLLLQVALAARINQIITPTLLLLQADLETKIRETPLENQVFQADLEIMTMTVVDMELHL